MRYAIATLAATAALFSLANAHVQMLDPPPFRSKANPFVADGDKDFNMNSPLDPTGANFPCKHYIDGTPSVASYGPGEHTITLAGGAVHGGGSCQVSLSYNNGAVGSFKVITSHLGGCPSSQFPGNAPNPEQEYTIPFTIPADAKSGDAILSWSWFNKIGNREMYQNCAHVTITGSGSNTLDSLPDLFVANIGNGCATTEGTDVVFPNPGSVVVNGGGNPGAPVGTCGSSGSGSAPPPAFSVSIPGQNLVGTKTEITTPTTLAKVTTAPPPAATTATAVETPEQPATTTTQTVPQPTGSTGDNNSTTDCSAGVVICAPDGLTWKMCGDIQGNTFQVPPGTVCKNGAFDFAKRDLSHDHARRSHLRKRTLGRKHL